MFFFINSNFNSIKVQLNPSKECQPLAASSFQFHKGTIKPEGLQLVETAEGDFNSIKVQLNPPS